MEEQLLLENPMNRQKEIVTNAAKTIGKGICCARIPLFLSKLSRIIRLLVAAMLLASFGITIAVAYNFGIGIMRDSGILYASATFCIIGAFSIIFDTFGVNWIVERVLNQLSSDVVKLETDLKRFENDLSVMEQNNANLTQNNQKLASLNIELKNETSKLALINSNMKVLISSLMDAQSEGVNLNELISQNLNKLEVLVNDVAKMQFANLDINHDGVVTPDEFALFTGTRVKSLIRKRD